MQSLQEYCFITIYMYIYNTREEGLLLYIGGESFDPALRYDSTLVTQSAAPQRSSRCLPLLKQCQAETSSLSLSNSAKVGAHLLALRFCLKGRICYYCCKISFTNSHYMHDLKIVEKNPSKLKEGAIVECRWPSSTSCVSTPSRPRTRSCLRME